MNRCISLESKTEWNIALKGIKHSFSHTWENCYAMNLTTGYNTYLYCFEKGNAKVICPISERSFEGYSDIVTPYGFSGFTGTGDCDEFQKYWREFALDKNYVCGYISMNPAFINDAYFDSKDSFYSTDLYFIDLDQSLTQLFDNMDSNRKREIKNFRKAEAKFIYDKKVLTEFFIHNYYSFLEKINASKANYFSRETLEFICNLENVFMVGAGEYGNIESVYIFAYTDYCGDCLFNVATPEGRHHSPTLLWSGLKFLKSKKIPLMNLGGGSKSDDSIALSKQRFGATALPFLNLKQIYNPVLYKELSEKVSQDSSNLPGYFPAYRSLIRS